jgi:hypothetical protein
MSTAAAIEPIDEPLANVDWGSDWDTAEAADLFRSVRALCGVRVGPPELTAEMIETALQEARQTLEEAGEPEPEPDKEFAEVVMSFAEAGRLADKRQPIRASVAVEQHAPSTTVEALMFGLRRGPGALNKPAVRRRLATLNDDQALDVGMRLQKFRPEIAEPWSTDQVEALFELHERLK